MEKLKCESCGANLEIDENNKYATCPYCNLKYKLKQDNNLNIKLELDEETKATIKKGGGFLLKLGIGHFIITGIISLLIVGVVILSIIKIINSVPSVKPEIKENKNNDDSSDSNYNEYDSNFDKYDDMKQKIEKSSFNSKYELYSGKQSKYLLKTIFDSVATNNSKNSDKKITIVCNGVSTEEPEEINNLYNSLQDKEYEAKLDYDDNGYVNKITII